MTSLTINAAAVGDILYDLDWYKLPETEQKMIRMVLRRCQSPYIVKGAGFFSYSLYTYAKVRFSLLQINRTNHFEYIPWYWIYIENHVIAYLLWSISSIFSWCEAPFLIIWYFGKLTRTYKHLIWRKCQNWNRRKCISLRVNHLLHKLFIILQISRSHFLFCYF